MGLLNKKETIIDMVLTDRGRFLMSKNQLSFVFYAFADETIDYRAISASNYSGSIDDTVFRNVAFEANQRKDQDLKSFLYTVQAKEKTFYSFKSFPESGSFSLERKFENKTFNAENVSALLSNKPLALIVKGTEKNLSTSDRNLFYILQQNINKLLQGR